MAAPNNPVEIEMESTNDCTTETTSILSSDKEPKENFKMQPKNPRWIGSTLALCYRNGSPLFTIGPHWPFYICLNLIIIAFTVAGLYFVVAKVSTWATVVGTILFLIQFTSYFLTSMVNPGIPSKRLSLYDQLSIDRIIDNPDLYCKICRAIKKRGSFTLHCEDCDVCIEGYDHHCPWTGKCIGKGNLLFFKLFLGSTLIYILYLTIASCLCLTQLINPKSLLRN